VAALGDKDIEGKDRVLVLIERGTVNLARGAYEQSARDFIEASDALDDLEAYSISKGGASFVANDNVQDFKALPFERTLLHAFAAKSHLAVGHWENAAVEARRIIYSLNPERLGEYPEDAYSRYMAGFCLELMDDPSNAALQYRKANALVPHVKIDDSNGRLLPGEKGAGPPIPAKAWTGPSAQTSRPCELVCFILAGRSPAGADMLEGRWPESSPVFGDVYAGDRYLGRGYALSDTVELAFTNIELQAARKAAKTIARVAIKEGIAAAVDENDEMLGMLVRFILIGLLEQPDVRRWETLPRWLAVARLPCPSDIESLDVVLKTASGREIDKIHLAGPFQRQGNVFVCFCRDTGD